MQHITEARAVTPSQKKSQQRRHAFRCFLSSCRHVGIGLVFFSVVVNVLLLTLPLYMLQVYDRVLNSQSMSTLFYLTLIAVFALLVLSLLDMVRSRLLLHVSVWMRERLMPTVLAQSAVAHLNGNKEAKQSQQDLTTLTQFIGSPSVLTLMDAPWVPFYLCMIGLMHPTLGALACGGAVLLLGFAYWHDKNTRALLQQTYAKQQNTEQSFARSLQQTETVQAMGMMPAVLQHYQDEQTELGELQRQLSQRNHLGLAIAKFTRLVLQLLLIGVGASLVIHQEMTAGMMIASSIMLGRALGPVEQSFMLWRQIGNALHAYSALDTFFDSQVSDKTARTVGLSLPAPKGDFRLEDVSCQGLSHLHCQITAGSVVGILGNSGAGKTRFVRALLGLSQPTSGTVRLDGADIHGWSREALGQHIGYVSQQAVLLPGSIKNNIARLQDEETVLESGAPDSMDAKVIAAAKRAGVHERILQLPQAYDTDIDEAAAYFSGGLQQQITIARAFYNNPAIIVLDEASNHLDHFAQAALLQSLKEAKAAGQTIIIVAHSPLLMPLVDDVIVMHNGNIQTQGPREPIMKALSRMQTQSDPGGAAAASHAAPAIVKLNPGSAVNDRITEGRQSAAADPARGKI